MTVPYTFGNEQSPIPLSQLDANFAVTPTFANTAGNVANAAQPNITSVGTLVALSVTGNITGGNLTTAGVVTATGNISAQNFSAVGNIAGNYILGNGSQLSGSVVHKGKCICVATNTWKRSALVGKY